LQECNASEEEKVMRQLLFTLTALGLLLAPAAADQIIIGERDGKDIVTVRATGATQSKQALTIFTGISANTAGANGLLLKVIIPSGVGGSSCAQGL
jgi:hypothetical protein